MKIIQKLAQMAFGPYTIFVVLSDELPEKISIVTDARVAAWDEATLNNASQGAWRFSYVDEKGVSLCTCAVWFGERYKTRGYWPLKVDECKLINLATLPEAKGKGLAPLIISQAAKKMSDLGFRKIYARVWHSNAASLRALAKAGWKRHSLVIEIFPGGRRFRATIPYRWMRWM